MTFLFLLSSLAGSFIQTVSGFGFGLFTLSLFPYFMPSTTSSVAISNLLSMSLSAVVAFNLRKRINVKLLLPSLAGFFVTSASVIFFFSTKPDSLLKKMVAVALVLMSVYFMFFSKKMKIKAGIRNGAISGALGGIMGGLFGMGGPPMALYLLNATEDPEDYLANIQAYFVIANGYSTIMRIFAGVVDKFVLTYWLIGLPVAFLGGFFGRKAFQRIPADGLRKIIYGFMALSGIVMFFG